MPEKFELIGKNGDINGVLYMRYGSGIDDPKPFLLTLTGRGCRYLGAHA